MEAFVFLLPVAIIVGLVFLGLFYWGLRGGQFDDTEGPAHRMIFDDDNPIDKKKITRSAVQNKEENGPELNNIGSEKNPQADLSSEADKED